MMSSNGKNGSIQTLIPVLAEIPKREDIFSLEGNSNQLQPFLLLDKPPDNLKETPPILSFQRKRDIEIPWEQVLGNTATEGLFNYPLILFV